MSEIPIGELLQAAREGARHAFLTKPGGVRYGAAVWTSSGSVHRCGQYSSFNHSTNIHAEMGALAIAAAAGDPDVRALLLVSTAAISGPARPCGVCRQVIAEHAKRIGRQIVVLMASWDGKLVERMTSDELLPAAWEGGSPPREQPWMEPDPAGGRIEVGDYLELRPGVVGRVICVDWMRLGAFVEPKFVGAQALASPHAEWDEYQRQLHTHGLGRVMSWGDRAVFADAKSCRRIPRLPISAIGVTRVRPLVDLLEGQRMFVSGSHALGVNGSNSSLRLVLESDLGDDVRRRLGTAMLEARWIRPPSSSSSWARLDSCGCPPAELVRQGRLVSRFELWDGDRWTQVVLAWTMPLEPHMHREYLREGASRIEVRGTVGEVRRRASPAQWILLTEDNRWRVMTWHDDATMLEVGDEVTLSCWTTGSAHPLYQFSAGRDFIRFERLAAT
jgi:cytidine deaminase